MQRTREILSNVLTMAGHVGTETVASFPMTPPLKRSMPAQLRTYFIRDGKRSETESGTRQPSVRDPGLVG